MQQKNIDIFFLRIGILVTFHLTVTEFILYWIKYILVCKQNIRGQFYIKRALEV